MERDWGLEKGGDGMSARITRDDRMALGGNHGFVIT